jgi:hypothetical protein
MASSSESSSSESSSDEEELLEENDYFAEGVRRCSRCHWEVAGCACRSRKSNGGGDELHTARPSNTAVVLTSMPMGMKELRESGLFSDIEVIVEGRVFACHRIVLWCASHYFRGLLVTGAGMIDGASTTVEVREVRACHFEAFLTLVYTGSCTVERDDLSELAQMADLLQSSAFTQACDYALSREVTDCTWPAALDFAARLCLPTLKRQALAVAAARLARGTFLEVFLKLDACHLVEIAKSDRMLLVKLIPALSKNHRQITQQVGRSDPSSSASRIHDGPH